MLWRSLTVAVKSHCGVNVHFWGRLKEVELRCSVCPLKLRGVCKSYHIISTLAKAPGFDTSVHNSTAQCVLSESHTFIICCIGIEGVYRRRDTRVGCCKRQRSTFAHISACSSRRPGPDQGVRRLLPLSG